MSAATLSAPQPAPAGAAGTGATAAPARLNPRRIAWLVGSRVGGAVLVLWIAITLTFIAIRLMPGDHYPGSLCLSGAFRVMIRNFYHYRSVDFNNGRNGSTPELRRSESLTVNFSISAEPKMPLLGAGLPIITEVMESSSGATIGLPRRSSSDLTCEFGNTKKPAL